MLLLRLPLTICNTMCISNYSLALMQSHTQLQSCCRLHHLAACMQQHCNIKLMALQGRGNWLCMFAGQVTSVASANSQSISQASSVTSTAVAQAFSAVSLSHHTQSCHIGLLYTCLQTAYTAMALLLLAFGTMVPEGNSPTSHNPS